MSRVQLPIFGGPRGPGVIEVQYSENGAARPGGSLTSLGRLPRFAHHPDCGRYDHHLLRPFGVSLCLGCTCTTLGGLASVVVLVFSPLPTSVGSAVLLFLVAMLGAVGPTFLQPHIQRRWFKVPARALLGAGLVLAMGAAWHVPWTLTGVALKVAMLLVTLVCYRLSTRYRQTHLNNPCNGCPWGGFPLCAHNLPRMIELRRAAEDTGMNELLDMLIAQLTPLSRTAPRMNAAPEIAASAGNIRFTQMRLPASSKSLEAE